MAVSTALIMLGFGVWTVLLIALSLWCGIHIGWRKSAGVNPAPDLLVSSRVMTQRQGNEGDVPPGAAIPNAMRGRPVVKG